MTTETVEQQLESIQTKLDATQDDLETRNRRIAELEKLDAARPSEDTPKDPTV
jgi:hypothetical protein